MLTEESPSIPEPPAAPPPPPPPPPLSDQQRRAVEHSEGPLIVLAGPGTGKTRVITERIARLVAAASEPSSIVAVTFTIKAARELRERLRNLIGPGPADRVNAHTFHSFGWRLIRRFSDYLGLPAEPRIIDSAQTRRLLRALIREHDLFPELLPTGRSAVVNDALGSLSLFANSAVFPSEAADFAHRWSARLRAGAGRLDDEALAAEHARQRRFAQMAELYALFAAACAERGWLTLDDLILYPIRLLRERPAAAAIIRDDYRHFVVDEFQDANLAQIELLKALAPPHPVPPAAALGGRCSSDDEEPHSLFSSPKPRSLARARDLCVVGDDDQSIYEFRGADDLAFARFARTWPDHTVVALSRNFRSQRPIIDAANALIGRAEERFAPDKQVEPADPAAPPLPGAAVECLATTSDHAAGQIIAAAILADRAASPSAPPRPFSSYAVIARTKVDLDRIGAALQLEGIPVRLARPPSALDDPGIKDLLRWVALLASPPGDPHADYATQWLLSRPPFHIPAPVLLEWLHGHRASRSRAAVLGGPGAPPAASPEPLSSWLARHHADDPAHGPALRRFLDLETGLRQLACHAPADAALFEVIRRADIAHAELLDARERAARVMRLADCLRFVRARLDALDPPADLAAFWSYYNDLSEEEREFRALGEDQLDRRDTGDDDHADAVTLLTAHSAKGLEFDTVFIARARPPHGFPKTSGDERDALPAGLVERPGALRSAVDRALAEERRLFYVACTRARRRLVVLAKRQKSRGQGTDFFTELTLDQPCCAFTIRRTGEEVLRAAADLGVRLVAHTELDDASGETAAARPIRAELIRRARRDARTLAARALDTTDRPAADPAALDAAAAALRESAQRLAIAAHLEQHGALPEWARDGALPPSLREYADRLQAAWTSGLDQRPFIETLFRPLAPPINLSYSWINEYRRCPRCFYLRRILRVSEPPGKEQLVGVAAHAALRDFYARVRSADAGEGPHPTLDNLLDLGREAYLAALPSRAAADRDQLDQLLAQLRLTHERLHDPAAEIEQLEFQVRVPYPGPAGEGGMSRATGGGATGGGATGGGATGGLSGEAAPASALPPTTPTTHTLEAKFDRLDRLPPPHRGHRIIDYKTGRASKPLLEPRPDDLQIAIYAMALSHHQHGADRSSPQGGGAPRSGAEGATPSTASTLSSSSARSPSSPAPPSPLLLPAEGEFQYWLLSTGQRTAINLADIDYPAVKQIIDETLAGMLAGRFERDKGCWDLCTTFARD